MNAKVPLRFAALSALLSLSQPAAALGTFPTGVCSEPGSIHVVRVNPPTPVPPMTGSVTVAPVYIGTPKSSSPTPISSLFRQFYPLATKALNWLPAVYGTATISSLLSTDLVIQYPHEFGVGASIDSYDIANELAWNIAYPMQNNFPSNLDPNHTLFVVYVSEAYLPWFESTDQGPLSGQDYLCYGEVQKPGTFVYKGYNAWLQPQASDVPKDNIYIAVIADATDSTNVVYSGCYGSTNTITAAQNSLAPIWVHEMGELLASAWESNWPNPTTGQPSGCQIGDLCQNQRVPYVDSSGNTWQLEPMWSNRANGCVGPTPGADADIVGNGTSDVAFANTGTPTFPVAVPDATIGQFDLTNLHLKDDYDLNGPTAFAWWATQAPSPLVGDFDGDGFADVALTGASGWTTIPVGYSAGPCLTLDVTNSSISGQPFASFTAGGALPPVVGDFDGDGRADIATAGGPGWNTIPVAFSNGRASCSGTTTCGAGSVVVGCTTSATSSFTATNNGGPSTPEATFNQVIANSRQSQIPQLLAGDFNGDGFSDLALVGGRAALTSGQYVGTPWTYVVVALNPATLSTNTAQASRTGLFNWPTAWSLSNSDFGGWSTVSLAVAADINGDGYTDIVLSGGSGWNTVPVAFSNGNGSFTVANLSDVGVNGATRFSSLTPQTGVQLFAGDWTGQGYGEIAAWNGGWSTMPASYFELFGWGDYNASFNLGSAGALGTSASQMRYYSIY